MSRLSRLFSSTTAPTKCKKRPVFRPVLESLEGRTLMAGNVVATFDPGNVLTLRGAKGHTNEAHAIKVNQLADGGLRVEATATADGTKSLINGAPFVIVHGAQFLNVFFGSGPDHVAVGGDGPIALKNVTIGVGNTANVASPGALPDIVTVENLTGNALAISTGAGDDAVFVKDVKLNGNMDVSTGFGNNSLDVLASNARNVSALMGKGVNGVVMLDVHAQLGVSVNTDVSFGAQSNDVIIMSHVSAGDTLSVNSNNGSDLVRLSNVSAGRNLNVNLGAGNDTLSLVHARANNINLNGGAGFDHLTKIDVDFGTHMRMAGFEQITNLQIDPDLVDNPPLLTFAN